MNIDIKEYIDIEQGKNYPLFKSIRVKKNSNFQKYSFYEIEVILASKNDDELILLFQEAFNIKINPIDGVYDSYVDIIDVSAEQVENATYFVSGNEDEEFSFYCKSFIFYKGTKLKT